MYVYVCVSSEDEGEEEIDMEVENGGHSDRTPQEPIRESVTFRRRSSSDPDFVLHQVAAGQTGSASLTSFSGHWPSLSASVPTPTSPAAHMLSQGGTCIYVHVHVQYRSDARYKSRVILHVFARGDTRTLRQIHVYKWVYTRRQTRLHKKANVFALYMYLASDL